MNCKMAELQRALERAGFEDVKTVLSSGNAVFRARLKSEAAIARKVELATAERLGTPFFTLVRSIESLQALVASEPFAGFRLAAGSKRIVTFLREPPVPAPQLPIERDGARVLALRDDTVLSAYVPSAKGPVFMSLLEKTFGKQITTRTWDTVLKVVAR